MTRNGRRPTFSSGVVEAELSFGGSSFEMRNEMIKRFSKPSFFLVVVLLANVDGSSANAATFRVNTTADGVDARPGDGTCSYGVLGGSRTLIEGIISNNNRTGNSGYFDYGSLPEHEISASGAMGEAAGPGSLL
jgi:hypothetical protein